MEQLRENLRALSLQAASIFHPMALWRVYDFIGMSSGLIGGFSLYFTDECTINYLLDGRYRGNLLQLKGLIVEAARGFLRTFRNDHFFDSVFNGRHGSFPGCPPLQGLFP